MKNSLDRTPLILTLICFVAILLGLRMNHSAITFTDEVLFEEASFRMARDGNWLIPHLSDNQPWLEKPPLYFWLTGVTFKIANTFNPAILDLTQSMTDQNIYQYPWIRRFWTIIAAAISVLSNYLIAKKLLSQDHGIAAAIILIATPLFLIVATAGNLDTTSTACISLAILSYLHLKTKATPQYAILTGIAIASGVMIRSFLAFTPIAVILIDQFHNRNIKLKHLTIIGITTLLLIIPWHLYIFLNFKNEFLHTYLGFNALEHGLTIPEGYQANPPYYYLGLQAHAPWLIFALIHLWNIAKNSPINSPSKIRHFFKKISNAYNQITHAPDFPITLWFLIPFLMLSLAATRHPWYAIQFLPPIAILASPTLIRLKNYMYNRPPSPKRYLLEITLMSFILSGPMLIMSSNFDKQASTVEAYLEASTYETTDQPVYTLGLPYYPQTLLYAPHQSQTINVDELDSLTNNSKNFTLFVSNYYQEKFNQQTYNKQLLKTYDSGQLYLINPQNN